MQFFFFHSLTKNCHDIIFPIYHSLSPDQVKCSLVWAADEHSLLVGWMNTLCVCNVRKRNAVELPSRDLPEHIVEQGKILCRP